MIAAPFMGAALSVVPVPQEPSPPYALAAASQPVTEPPPSQLAPTPAPPPAVAPARFVLAMAGEGALVDLVRVHMRATDGADGLARLSGPLQDAWLESFYGDKPRLRVFIEQTAAANGLPEQFLLRLLQQESGLDHRAVSRAGAQGVAQFMPGTASERGLADPFDPFEAIPKAAEFIREQRASLGNLGLATAAYNAGPQRVRNWLAGRSRLPQETRAYVEKITGRTAEDWRANGDLYAVAEPVP